MEHPLYEMKYPTAKVGKILEALRLKIAKEAGVTLVGNRLTVRWNMPDRKMAQVHMIIENVEDGEVFDEEEYD